MTDKYEGKRFFPDLTLKEYDNLYTQSYNKQMYWEMMLYEMIYLLPSAYNKEVQDTNYYKLLRGLALELADAKIEADIIEKNTALKTASGESIYNNFGILVKLRRRSDWNDEKYRGLVSGVIKSLLMGPTKESMIDAFRLFFNFDVNIYELFNNQNIMPEYTNRKFTFVLELEIPIEIINDTPLIESDSTYLINIIKPAHTLHIFLKTYVSEDNYSKNYSIDKYIYKWADHCLDLKIKDYINKTIEATFKNEAESSGKNIDDFSTDVRGIKNTVYIQNILDGGIDSEGNHLPSLRKKYLEYLKSIKNCDILIYPIPQILLVEAKYKIYEFYNLEQFFNDKFPTIDSLLQQLSAEFIGDASKVTEETKQYFLDKLNPLLIESTFDSMTSYEKNILQDLDEKSFEIKYSDYTESEINEIANQISDDFDITLDDAFLKMKRDSLYETILNTLGGRIQVYKSCLSESEKWREDLENKYKEVGKYCGMDEMIFSASHNQSEGIFGWKSLGHPLQLITTTDKNKSKIGGVNLIGPIYTLHEEVEAIMTDKDGNLVTNSDFPYFN